MCKFVVCGFVRVRGGRLCVHACGFACVRESGRNNVLGKVSPVGMCAYAFSAYRVVTAHLDIQDIDLYRHTDTHTNMGIFALLQE